MSSEDEITGQQSELIADVVVLGASFAGVEVALQLLRHTTGRPLSVFVVDAQTQHPYLPLVQERLCGRLPIEGTRLRTAAFIDSLPNARFIQGDVVSFDPDKKIIRLASGLQLRSRFVVVAMGSVLEPPRAIEGREQMLAHKTEVQFNEARIALKQALLDASTAPEIVVVGGGITGVELAGELAALRHHAPPRWTAPRVKLVCATDRLVADLHPHVGKKVHALLTRQGVKVLLQTRAVAVEQGLLRAAEAGTAGRQPIRELAADLVFWAGGVQPSPILANCGLPLTDEGWLAVGPTLQCFATTDPRNHPEIFACGDAARVIGGQGRWPTMVRAIEAFWQAKTVAANIAALAKEPAHYNRGVPPLRPHKLRASFFYGVSVGRRSLIVRGPVILDVPWINHWFRRWLMGRYFARYRSMLLESKQETGTVPSLRREP